MDRRSLHSCALLTHPPTNNKCSLEVPKREMSIQTGQLNDQWKATESKHHEKKAEDNVSICYFDWALFWLVVPSGAVGPWEELAIFFRYFVLRCNILPASH